MEHDPKNRMEGSRRPGRPTLVESLERQNTPPPGIVKEPDRPVRLQCSHCGCMFEPRVAKTVGNVRYMRCDRCGYTHPIPPSLLARMTKT